MEIVGHQKIFNIRTSSGTMKEASLEQVGLNSNKPSPQLFSATVGQPHNEVRHMVLSSGLLNFICFTFGVFFLYTIKNNNCLLDYHKNIDKK